MDVFIARQPIFDANKRLYAYELLYRESIGGKLGEIDGDRATTSLLSSSFLTEGLETITAGKPCFINFTEKLLCRDIAGFFPKTKIVIEILETVQPTKAVLAACEKLSSQGYMIALDDFVYRRELEPLIRLADIIKIDFRQSDKMEIERILHRLSRYSVKFLAEKIETYEEFDRALLLGFTYFQGYFFSYPEKLTIREIASFKLNLLQLLAEIHRKKTTVDRLDRIISRDVGITYKLLRYINSAYFYLLQEVTSVRQAIIYLGADEIRRFVTLVVISELATDKPEELIKLSIIRGRFCELLGRAANVDIDSSEMFLLGLFSLLDALLDTPMKEVLRHLPLSDALKNVLTGQGGEMLPWLQLVIACERGDGKRYTELLTRLGLAREDIAPLYLHAVQFAETISKAG